MSEMQNNIAICLPVTEGTEDEILAELRGLCYSTRRGVDTKAVLDAIEHIQGGDLCVQVAGEQFVVVEPEWSIEQDVFGCEKGRGCTDVTPAQRERLEALLVERLEAGGDRERLEADDEDDERLQRGAADEDEQHPGALEAES